MKIMKVAKYLIYLASKDEGYNLTPLKLQKLLYYCQGFSYAWDGQQLFSEEFEAWKYGPVNRDVYDVFKMYGNAVIPFDEGKKINKTKKNKDSVETIQAVWDNFKEYGAFDLVEMTHSEKPWKESYPAGNDITNKQIRKYFQSTYS